MDIMGGLSAFGGGLVGYIVPFLFVLTIVVFFHELGHFLVARWCGVKVVAFSIGFGPEIIGFNDRYGTRWKIAAIPLGGYVKFFGDDNAASVPDLEAAAGMSEAEKKVGLSLRAAADDEEKNRLEDYQRQAQAATTTIEEVMSLKDRNLK